MKIVKSNKSIGYMLAAVVGLSSTSVFAASALDGTLAAISASITDATTVGYAVMGALASIFVFKMIRRVL